MKLKRRSRDGTISVVIQTPAGKREFSTGTKDPVMAHKAIEMANVEAQEVMSLANALTIQIIRKLTPGGKIAVEDAILEWSQWLKQTARSPYTAHTYLATVQSWSRRMRVKATRLCDINAGHITRFVNGPDAGKLNTRNIKHAALLSFFKYLCDVKQYLAHDPSKEVSVRWDLLTHEQKLPKVREIFTDDEIKRITNFLSMRLDFLMNGTGVVPQRALMIRRTTFFYCATLIGRASGLRIGDIATLEWATFAADNNILKVCTDKANTWVEIPIGDMLSKALAAIPRNKSRHCFPEQAAWVGTPKSKKLSMGYGDILKTLDIKGKSFHCLRHSKATEMDGQGWRREYIAKMLGHKSTKVTDGYIHTNGNQTTT